MTQAECIRLAVLQLAARNSARDTLNTRDQREAIPKPDAWKRAAAVLLARDALRITSQRDVFLITAVGEELRRQLEARGVAPAPVPRLAARAHLGEETTSGAETNERRRRAAAQRQRRAAASSLRGDALSAEIPGCGQSVEGATLDPPPKRAAARTLETFEPLVVRAGKASNR